MADVVYVSDNGLGVVTNRIIGAGTEFKYLIWGTGAGTAAATDTIAQMTNASETTTTAVTGTSSRVTTSTTNDTYQVVATVTCAGAGKTITEIALLDQATVTGATFCLHGTFTGIALNVGDSIEFTVKTQFNQA